MAQLMTNGTSPVGTVPACFHSELAEKTSWTPLARQTMSFCSHRLGPDPMTGGWRFCSTPVLRLFGILPTVFIVVTLGILLLAGKLNPLRTLLAELPILYVIVAGACIGSVVIGVWLWRRMNPVIVFDGLREAFYRAPRNPRGMEVSALDSFTPFQEIGALQLLERRVVQGSGKNAVDYLAYELNLVRRDGSRVSILCHGNYPKLAADAEQLAGYLQCPCWDATGKSAAVIAETE